MKLRLLPILIAVAVSAVVLFGGYFFYQSVALANPLIRVVDKAPGVQNAQADIASDRVTFHLKLNGDADLRELFRKIDAEGRSIIGKKEIKFDIESNSTPELEKWWSTALFDVAQAMETKQYSKIPESLQAKAGNVPGLTVQTEMDEKNVYVRLTQGEHSKYVVLPRVPATLGVWPN